MIRSWSIGDIRVTRIVEYYGPTHDPATTFPEFDRDRFDRHLPSLPPGHWVYVHPNWYVWGATTGAPAVR